MLPQVITDIIESYVASMNYYTDLPSERSVMSLMERCDRWVLGQIGQVLGMPSNEVMRLRFRLEMRGDFVFYFHMSADQRMEMLRRMERALEHNKHISCMTWIYLEQHLIRNPRFNRIFRDGLYCRMMEYLITEPPLRNLI